jgi:hypothetical protein
MYKKHGFKIIDTKSDADGKYYIMKRDTSVNEETRIEPDKLPKFIYHISTKNHNGEVFEPRKYDNDNVKNDMERYVSRVCFADSIDGCLYSIFPNGAYDADFYVHIPAHEVKVYSTTKEDIYDSEITHELWVKEPVEMKCIGKIHVSGVSNKDTKVITIDSDKVPYNKKKYHRCIWSWAEKYFEDKSLFESYIEESLETRLVHPTLSRYVDIYHGTYSKDFDVINPTSYNMGTKLSKPRVSSFWFIDIEYAKAFSVMEIVRKNLNKRVKLMIDKDMKAAFPESCKSEIINILKKKAKAQ